MASLAARRRVSFDAPRQSRQDRLALNRNDYTSDEDDEEDEEERIARDEEEEEERRLSAANGEAAEAPSSTKKRKQTDQEIAAEYSTTIKKSKPRVTLQPTHLTGADGLIRIQSDLASLKYPKKRSSHASAAAYSRSLIKAYKSWAYNLLPSIAFEDVMSRIETFGSKREIKNHISHMRTDVRNAHLERLFGKERSENMLRELEDGLKQQFQHVEDEIQVDALIDFRSTQSAPTTGVLERVVPTTRASVIAKQHSPPPNERAPPTTKSDRPPQPLAFLDDSESEEELEFELKPSTTAAVPTSTFVDTDDESDDRMTIASTKDPTSIACQEGLQNADESVLLIPFGKALDKGGNKELVGDVGLEDLTQIIAPASQFQNSHEEDSTSGENERVLAFEASLSAGRDTDLEPAKSTLPVTQFDTQTTQLTVHPSQTQNLSDDEPSGSQLTATQATVLASQIDETHNDESPSFDVTTTQDTL